MSNVLAIDIGGTHFRVGLFDPQTLIREGAGQGRSLRVSEGRTDRAGGRVWMLAQLRERGQALLAQADAPVTTCGVSFGGPVDFARQRVTSLHAQGWKDFALAQWVSETFHLPCRMDNDANAGALGEFRFGVGRGTQSLAYVTLSTGIGCGLILDGRVYRGKDRLAGELGHIRVSDSGAVCSCGGKGCLEAYGSGAAIGEQAREQGRQRPEAVAHIAALSGGRVEDITAQAVFQAAADGDLPAVQIVRDAARWLARGLMIVIRVINPDRIVLGGGVSLAGATLLNPVREFLAELASPMIGYSTELALAELGTLSPLYGAAALAREAG